ncbi:MAG TPA: GntR family transcriptional regulator [Gaiellaceae bacterium]|nr:GntR family transcriptional regulator [Gaiellaceae bacterium]
MQTPNTTESPTGLVALDQRPLWQRAHERLRDEIISGRLTPGTELQEVVLAESLGVSRGPIREALGRLAAEGLVTVRPRRGAVVRALSAEEFLEAYQVREALEVMAVRLAVAKLTPDDLAELGRLIDEMSARAERGDVRGFFEANAAFHRVFFDVAGNRMLAELHRQVRDQIDRHRQRSLELRGNVHRSVAEHRAILRAVQSGDVERAAHLVSEHIRVPQIRLQVDRAGETAGSLREASSPEPPASRRRAAGSGGSGAAARPTTSEEGRS